MIRSAKKREQLRTIRLAMIELQQRKGLSEAARQRGLTALQQAYERVRKEQVG